MRATQNHHQLALLVFLYFLLFTNPVIALPIRARQNASTTVQTIKTTQTLAGPVVETCEITLTPITDKNGKPAVKEVKKCSISLSGSGTGSTPPGSTGGTESSTVLSIPITGTSSLPSATDSASSSNPSGTATSTFPSVTSSVSSTGSSATSTTVSATVTGGTSTFSVSSTASSDTLSSTSSISTSTLSATSVSSFTSATFSSASAPTTAPGISVNGLSTVTGIPSPTATASSTATQTSGTAGADSNGAASGASPSGASAAAAESPSSSDTAAFTLPGKKLSVLPIGLGVFAGISVIALIVVGLVTYERTKYRKAFRQRKLAEQGGALGYGGMASAFCSPLMVSTPIKSVDYLRITFLVDNCIEWMTKLPPGFTHELPQHVQQDSKRDETTGVPVLDFDNFCCGAHGFAALIETRIGDETHLILFDTGPDSRSLVRNVRAMQVPVDRIERVVTSHWHSDHTGGLLSFLELREARSVAAAAATAAPVVVDVHPDRPMSRGIAPGPSYDKVLCALPPDPTFEQIEAGGGLLEMHAEGHAVAAGTVWVSGEIPRVTEFETGIPGGMRWAGGDWVHERHIMDERYAAIDVTGKGLVIFSSCSHAGIVNVLKDAVNTFARPIYMVVGGLHLAGPEFSQRITPTVEFLSRTLRPSPAYVLPMHCSGFQSKLALEAALGEGCVPVGVGHRVDITGDVENDDRLFPPTF